MDRTRRCTTQSMPSKRTLVLYAAAPLLLAAALVKPCRAESTFASASPGGGPLTATAHLDFRVIVLPSLGLSTQASGVRIQGNSGVLTVQRGPSEAWDGQAPASSAQLQLRARVVDRLLQTPASAGDLITVASP